MLHFKNYSVINTPNLLYAHINNYGRRCEYGADLVCLSHSVLK